MEDLIADEQVIITISEDDYIKRMPIDTFREQRRGGQGVTGMEMKHEDDALKGIYVASTHDYLLIFTNLRPLLLAKSVADSRNRPTLKGKPLINLLEDIRPTRKSPPSYASQLLKKQPASCWQRGKASSRRPSSQPLVHLRRKGI